MEEAILSSGKWTESLSCRRLASQCGTSKHPEWELELNKQNGDCLVGIRNYTTSLWLLKIGADLRLAISPGQSIKFPDGLLQLFQMAYIKVRLLSVERPEDGTIDIDWQFWALNARRIKAYTFKLRGESFHVDQGSCKLLLC